MRGKVVLSMIFYTYNTHTLTYIHTHTYSHIYIYTLARISIGYMIFSVITLVYVRHFA